MTFSPGQLVICVEPDEHKLLIKGRVYTVSEAGFFCTDTIAVKEAIYPRLHFRASRFRPVPRRQLALVESIIEEAESAATLPAKSAKGHEVGG